MPTPPDFPNATDPNAPYSNFRFRLKWDGRYVAGLSKVSGLTRTTQANPPRLSEDPSMPMPMPGQSGHGAIVLEGGVTYDAAFQQWAYKVWDSPNSPSDAQQRAANDAVSHNDLRRDVVLELYNEAGEKVLVYTIYRCWPSEFVPMPVLDSTGNVLAIERLTLENEGWERDTSLLEPTEPTFTLPAD